MSPQFLPFAGFSALEEYKVEHLPRRRPVPHTVEIIIKKTRQEPFKFGPTLPLTQSTVRKDVELVTGQVFDSI